MKVRVVVSVEIDLDEIYELCTPIDKRSCAKAVHEFVHFQVGMRAGEDGGWLFPDSVLIANHLVHNGQAIAKNSFV